MGVISETRKNKVPTFCVSVCVITLPTGNLYAVEWFLKRVGTLSSTVSGVPLVSVADLKYRCPTKTTR